jgi:hypothetical protein
VWLLEWCGGVQDSRPPESAGVWHFAIDFQFGHPHRRMKVQNGVANTRVGVVVVVRCGR